MNDDDEAEGAIAPSAALPTPIAIAIIAAVFLPACLIRSPPTPTPLPIRAVATCPELILPGSVNPNRLRVYRTSLTMRNAYNGNDLQWTIRDISTDNAYVTSVKDAE